MVAHIKEKMGKQYPVWLEDYYNESRGNAKYENNDVVDVDADNDMIDLTISTPFTSPSADKENSPNNVNSGVVDPRRGKVTQLVFNEGLKKLEAAADAQALRSIASDKANTDRVVESFEIATARLLGGIAAFQQLLAER